MGKKFLQPVRMESQFVDTKLQSVFFQTGASNAPVEDGTICVLGDFVADSVYAGAYTRAGQAGLAPAGINARKATVPTAATAVGVGVIDLANVATASGMGNTYRLGNKTIGLTAEAGVPVRFRKLVADDVFVTGSENCAGALTVGQYAVLTANSGVWTSAASAPETPGCYCKVVDKYIVSQGVDGTTTSNGVQAYRLLVVQN